jgi:hypothetical protein
MSINVNHTGAGNIVLTSDAAETLRIDGYKVWHENNDGATTGLDADLLDAQHGSYYLDAGNFTGTIPDAVVPASAVTQHEASLTILESQITDGTILARVGGNEAITGSWTFNTTLPTSSLTPSGSSDLTTKAYVDQLAQGLKWKTSARAATTGNVTLSGTQTIDGVSTLTTGDRLLVWQQTAPAENGIYDYNSAGAWTRSSDADSWTELVSAAIFVSEGTTYQDVGFNCTVDAGGTLGSTSVTWVQFTGSGTVYNAGNGLTESPAGTFNVGTASTARIVVNADDIDLATTAATPGSFGSASAVATYTVDAYGRLTASGSTSIQITESQITDGTLLARVGSTETITGAWTFNTTAPVISVMNTRIGPDTLSDTKQVLTLSAGQFSGAGDASGRFYILRRATTNGTQTEVTTDGATYAATNAMVMPNDTTWSFRVHVSARRADVDGESASYEYKGCIKRDGTVGSTAIVGSIFESVYAENTTAWTVAVDADTTNGALRVRVTGEAAKTIRWVAFVEVIQATG